MGIGGISIWQLLIILAIVVMLFGTKRLRTLGSDMGEMIKGFKNSVTDNKKNDEEEAAEPSATDNIEAKKTDDNK